MKKSLSFLAILLVFCLLLTGCGNSGTKTCVKEEKDDSGYKTTDTMKITYKNKKVTKVEDTNIAETDPEYIDLAISFGQLVIPTFNDLKGFEASMTKEGDNKIKTYISVDFSKVDEKEIKEKLDGMMGEDDDSFYSNKDITIDDFIKENADGYTCK